MIIRCCNIDWFEVYCIEPVGAKHDEEYFKACGYEVSKRDYGTPLYGEVLTIFSDGFPAYEIRRAPRMDGAAKAILQRGSCHIRLTNRQCYEPNAIPELQMFLFSHGYQLKTISRVDVCMDFNTLDNGTPPEHFIASWYKGEISKIYQTNFASFGSDTWSGRDVTSVAFGKPTSSVKTRIYNKSKEMREVKEKLWIKDAWMAASLDLSKDVWRIEFQLNSQVKVMRVRKPKNTEQAEEIQKRRLERRMMQFSSWDSQEHRLESFRVLSSHYLRFKYVERTRNGELKEKRRCKDYPIFNFSARDENYTMRKVTLQRSPSKMMVRVMNALNELTKDFELTPSEKQITAILIDKILKTYRIEDVVINKDDLQLAYEQSRKNADALSNFLMSDHYQRAMFNEDLERTLIEIMTTHEDAPF